MEYTFRPAGWGRFVIIPFLLFWLAGWGAFEWFAIRLVYGGWQGDPAIFEKWISHPMGWVVGGFALVWMTFWTFGGVSAIAMLVRITAGVDRIEISGLEWTIYRGVGPITVSTRIAATDVTDVWVERRQNRLMLETSDRDLVLTNLGTPDEQRAFAARHASGATRDELPHGWIATRDHQGGIVVSRSGIDSPGCLLLVAIVPAVWFAALIQFSEHIHGTFEIAGTVVAAMLAALAAWGTFRREEWHIRQGRVAKIVRWLGWTREKVLDAQSLDLSFEADSDGDERGTLTATSGGRKIVLLRTINDSRTITRLARYIASASGWRIVMPHHG